MRDYSKSIAETIDSFLKTEYWKYYFNEEEGGFDVEIMLRNRMKIHCLIYIYEHDYVAYSICPIPANHYSGKMMKEMAEFICRANYGLPDGNFEFNFRDGETRFKCFVDCEGGVLSVEMVRNSIYYQIAAYERYMKGIIKIILDDMTAGDAIELCEGKKTIGMEDYSDDGLYRGLSDTSIPDMSGIIRMLQSLRKHPEDEKNRALQKKGEQ